MNSERYTKDVIKRIQDADGSWFISRAFMLCPHRASTSACDACRRNPIIWGQIVELDNALSTRPPEMERSENPEETRYAACRCCSIATRAPRRGVAAQRCPMCSPAFTFHQCEHCHAFSLPATVMPPAFAHTTVCAHCTRRCPACGGLHAQGACLLERLRGLGQLQATMTSIMTRPCNLDILKHPKKGTKPPFVRSAGDRNMRVEVLVPPAGFSPAQVSALEEMGAEIQQKLIERGSSNMLLVIMATTKLHPDGPDFPIVGPPWGRFVQFARTFTTRVVLAQGMTSTSDEVTWIYVPMPTTDMEPADLLRRTLFQPFLGETVTPAYGRPAAAEGEGIDLTVIPPRRNAAPAMRIRQTPPRRVPSPPIPTTPMPTDQPTILDTTYSRTVRTQTTEEE